MTITVNSNFTVFADETYSESTGGGVFMIQGNGAAPALLNLGVIRSSAPSATGVGANGGTLDNRNLIEALGTQISTGAILSGAVLNNTGTIRAVSSSGAQAIGVSGDGPTTNAGTISARSGAPASWAIAMYYANGGSITNNGTLLAAAAATDIASGAFGIRNGRMELTGAITNNGTITAANMIGQNTEHTYGIHVEGLSAFNPALAPNIVNSGTITARWTIFSSATTDFADYVVNSGTLNGAVQLNNGDDRLDNTGTINGAVFMGAGDDRVTTTAGTITGAIDLGDGDDIFNGGAASDVVNGGVGSDQINGGGGHDVLRGDAGDDTISGGIGDDDLEGGSGPDRLFGNDGRDDLDGGTGDDELDGGAGLDIMRGGEGDDILHVRDDGEGIFEGGAGTDTLRLHVAFADFRTASVTTIERIEFVRPNAGVATMNAQFNASQISSAFFSPALVVSGSAAQDSIQIFLTPNETVSTAGWTFDFPSWGFDDYIVYTGAAGNENFTGFAGLDIFFAGGGNDVMNGGGAVDFAAYIFSVDAVTADLSVVGAQQISASQGFDTYVSIEGLAGSQLADTLRGSDGDNFLLGLHGNDTLIGRAGADDIRGGEHSDRIEGGLGADILWGAMDPAVMSGPDGADTFVYRNTNEGGDTIRDFQAGVDRIEVSAAGFGLTAGAAAVLRSGADPVAQGAGGQFLYDTDDGRFFFDADGAGGAAAVLLATLTTIPALTAADIVVTSITAASEGAVLEDAIAATDTPDLSVLGPDPFAMA